MRSKAHIKGHPIHPILVAFPIAFFSGTFLMDIIFLVSREEVFNLLAGFLEFGGIIFAFLAAIPGMIDYAYTVPPNSSGQKRATKHALMNVSMLLIFITSFLMRYHQLGNFYSWFGLETAGMIFLTIAGWLGGTLVHRNQIGVDHRYAHAGKWKELEADAADSLELKELEELKVNQLLLVRTRLKRIVLGKTENGFVAFDDHCTHRGGSLADGVMICGTVQCPWHGSQFDLTNGNVKAGPAKENIQVYEVTEAEARLLIHLR